MANARQSNRPRAVQYRVRSRQPRRSANVAAGHAITLADRLDLCVVGRAPGRRDTRAPQQLPLLRTGHADRHCDRRLYGLSAYAALFADDHSDRSVVSPEARNLDAFARRGVDYYHRHRAEQGCQRTRDAPTLVVCFCGNHLQKPRPKLARDCACQRSSSVALRSAHNQPARFAGLKQRGDHRYSRPQIFGQDHFIKRQ